MLKMRENIENPILKELFEILACPLCKADLEYTKGKKALACAECGRKYPIRDGIAVMVAK